MPTDDRTRKGIPVFAGFIRNFPDAIAAIAQSSLIANEQHNPGKPLQWDKSKSKEELESLARHLLDIAADPLARDPDGVLAAVKVGWRALANLQRLADSGVNLLSEPKLPHFEDSHEALTFGPLTEPDLTPKRSYDEVDSLDWDPEHKRELVRHVIRGRMDAPLVQRFIRDQADVRGYITELNRGYSGDIPVRESIDDATPEEWNALGSAKPL